MNSNPSDLLRDSSERLTREYIDKYSLKLPELNLNNINATRVYSQGRDGVIYSVDYDGDKDLLLAIPRINRDKIYLRMHVPCEISDDHIEFPSMVYCNDEEDCVSKIKQEGDSILDFIQNSITALESVVNDWNTNLELNVENAIKNYQISFEKKQTQEKGFLERVNISRQ